MKNVDNVIIRMYNTGSVGDCFLLLFQKEGQTTFSMLIDCGGYKTKKVAISECVQSIKESILNDTIDLVVITHEHEDHVSGFNQARTIFDGITFNQVWMSWAENQSDVLAQKLFKEKGKKIKALQSLIKKNLIEIQSNLKNGVRQNGFNRSLKIRQQNFKNALDALEFEDIQSLASPGVRLKVSDAMKYIKAKSKSKAKSKMYHKPGEVLEMKGAEGVKFHILGPPYDSDLHGIKNDLQHDQMYSITKRLGFLVNNFHYNAIAADSDKNITLLSPFSSKYKLDSNQEKEFKKEFYGTPSNRWRQIEYDWLDTAGELAIALTDFVNNTSLAFAIEINTQVLLFPADAQSGNWMSWHDPQVTKELKRNGGRDAKSLLAKTVFYKVGHHGSHNGTASLSGLEMMQEGKFIAFMPLIQDKVPTQWGGSKNFPAKPLLKKLIEKTNGAIIRTDEGLISDKEAKNLRQRRLSNAQITRLTDASKNALFHEWHIEVK
jgi:beta-lactamase superfamily II metal-dependent hydrolase